MDFCPHGSVANRRIARASHDAQRMVSTSARKRPSATCTSAFTPRVAVKEGKKKMRIGNIFSFAALPLLAACSSSSFEPQTTTTESQSEALVNDHRTPQGDHDHDGHAFRHVLLISIDGLHQVDLARFIKDAPSSALAKLARRGLQYANAYVNRLDGSPTNPSDSFPGLLALTTGGSSPSHGGWYDVSYARDLYPYSASAPCSGMPGADAIYDESIDADNTFLWGSASDDVPTHRLDVARSRIDVTKLPYAKKGAQCTPVYPHQFIRTNTIFNVIKKAGLHTAWSDKHLSYELVSGPTGDGVDDYFAPDINSDPAKSLIPRATPGGSFTDSAAATEVYDDFKVRAILNEIDGRWSDEGLAGARDTAGRPGVPAVFGMNFQAVSVAQKSALSTGGYADAAGTPGADLAEALRHTDASIAKMVDGLRDRDLLDSTLIVVTAKHGQSPIDVSTVHKVSGDDGGQLDRWRCARRLAHRGRRGSVLAQERRQRARRRQHSADPAQYRGRSARRHRHDHRDRSKLHQDVRRPDHGLPHPGCGHATEARRHLLAQ